MSADRALVIFSSLSPGLPHLNGIRASQSYTDEGRSPILTPGNPYPCAILNPSWTLATAKIAPACDRRVRFSAKIAGKSPRLA
ncbi:hypothetical protein [Oscillatoria sp. HE19RPO]|uniref:hypothetical protein n=1 Tax=Oscillatoria sp. HE19RPO TaxID=2954806 RepID=UPI0020C47C41|nr:hypothetical protein [Oscillatoria sp. HE19RPO]